MFIELTGWDTSTDEINKIYLSCDSIRNIVEEDKNGMRPVIIHFKNIENDHFLQVKESYEEVKRMIRGEK